MSVSWDIAFVSNAVKVGCDDADTFEALEPVWEYRDDGDWELFFINTEEWLHVRSLNNQEAIALKPAVRRKLGRGGKYTNGQDSPGVGDNS